MGVIFERRQAQTVYREHDPWPELTDKIQCVWTMATSDLRTVHRVVPDGGMNLLLEWTQKGFQCRLVGCLTKPLMKRYQLPTDVMAVRFRPGGAGTLFTRPAHHFTGNVLDATSFWNPADALASTLSRAKTSDQALESLNEFIARELSNSSPSKESLGKQVVNRIVANPEESHLQELCADFGRTRQQITRAVKAACGLSPKRLARILRLQRLIEVAAGGERNWAAMAVACGYYDQAHLIHDFHEFTGMPPARFFQERFAVASMN